MAFQIEKKQTICKAVYGLLKLAVRKEKNKWD